MVVMRKSGNGTIHSTWDDLKSWELSRYQQGPARYDLALRMCTSDICAPHFDRDDRDVAVHSLSHYVARHDGAVVAGSELDVLLGTWADVYTCQVNLTKAGITYPPTREPDWAQLAWLYLNNVTAGVFGRSQQVVPRRQKFLGLYRRAASVGETATIRCRPRAIGSITGCDMWADSYLPEIESALAHTSRMLGLKSGTDIAVVPQGVAALLFGISPWCPVGDVPLAEALLLSQRDAGHNPWLSVRVQPHGEFGRTLLSLIPADRRGYTDALDPARASLWSAVGALVGRVRA